MSAEINLLSSQLADAVRAAMSDVISWDCASLSIGKHTSDWALWSGEDMFEGRVGARFSEVKSTMPHTREATAARLREHAATLIAEAETYEKEAQQ
jgi:hypothetical protein